MRHLYKVALTIITVVIISCLSTLDIHAYTDHQSLVTESFDILADEQEDAYQFYFECFYSNKNFISIIIENSNKPDASSVDGGGILEANPNRLEGEYLVWDMPLDFGETIDVTVRYSSSHFPNLEVGAQYTGDSMPPREIIVLIAVLVAIVVIIIVAIVVKKNLEDPYYSYRGFCGRHHYYYFGNYNLFRRQGVNAEGKKITNPTTFRSGGLGGGGSSCACACACACAGGGRAGCSRKDFTQSAVDVEQMKHMDN